MVSEGRAGRWMKLKICQAKADELVNTLHNDSFGKIAMGKYFKED